MAAMFCLELAGKLEVAVTFSNAGLLSIFQLTLSPQHFERYHEAGRFFHRAIDLQVNVCIKHLRFFVFTSCASGVIVANFALCVVHFVI